MKRSEWQQLPKSLQERFFDLSEIEAKRERGILKKKEEKIKGLRDELTIKKIPDREKWGNWDIYAIDGSHSSVGNRATRRYAVYGAQAMHFKGDKLQPDKDELYNSDYFSERQTDRGDCFSDLQTLAMTMMERALALKIIKKKNPDLILMDGSFYGWKHRFSVNNRLENKPIKDLNSSFLENYDTVGELGDSIRRVTKKLIGCGKVAGIIKRQRSNSIDSYLTLKYKNESRKIGLTDKRTLSSCMKGGEYYGFDDYVDLVEKGKMNTSVLKAFQRFLVKYRTEKGKMSPKAIFERAYNERKMVSEEKLKRVFVKTIKKPGFFIEYPIKTNLSQLLSCLDGFKNEASGLPFPIDLVDENISISRDFVREFVDEVEARLVKENIEDLDTHFAPENPQKY